VSDTEPPISGHSEEHPQEHEHPPITREAMNAENPEAIEAIGEVPPIHLTEIGAMSEEEWLAKVYQGDRVPQLTWRAVLMGGILGSLMSISNLYTSIKVGWSFGVAITSCVLSFVIWNALRTLFPRLTPMSILENNCMQSTASAAGYSTGATIGVAFGALLLITGQHVDWKVMLIWTLVTAALGVFLAVPIKRQMINQERLPFPSGIAAAETLRSLYGRSRAAIIQAYALVCALVVGLIVGFLKNGEFPWQLKLGLKLPDLIPFKATVKNVDVSKFYMFGFDPSVLLIAAGMIVGMRVSLSMLAGSLLLYFVVAPQMVSIGEITEPAKVMKWSLWSGTGLMVTSGLTAFALQWKTIARSFTSIKLKKDPNEPAGPAGIDDIEVPMAWLVIGLVPLGLAMVLVQFLAFSINPLLGVLSVIMSFFLALVACRATGETDITPIGAMGKITQLTYGMLVPSNITTNLMAGSVTANIASSSADLLTDLKSGYLLGANARKQFIAQFIGLFFGTLAVVPAWYLMIPSKEALDKYNPPSANMWKAVAEAIVHGFGYVPAHARIGLFIGAALGIILAVVDAFLPKKYKPYMPSAMGLGLSWVVSFANSFAFFIGALIAWIWSKANEKNAELFVVPIASGAIAGESLMCALLAMYNAAEALLNKPH
ncbi:MAG: OPT family oligopeptide transporter, partial [Terriglobales bacterium]